MTESTIYYPSASFGKKFKPLNPHSNFHLARAFLIAPVKRADSSKSRSLLLFEIQEVAWNFRHKS